MTEWFDGREATGLSSVTSCWDYNGEDYRFGPTATQQHLCFNVRGKIELCQKFETLLNLSFGKPKKLLTN